MISDVEKKVHSGQLEVTEEEQEGEEVEDQLNKLFTKYKDVQSSSEH